MVKVKEAENRVVVAGGYGKVDGKEQ